ncbi:CBASS system CD-NTase-associated NAD(+) hydrolase Cap12 [Pontibacter sp. MBLB2868]|uniref:CBASS system CD-NTase-associated NAD(+) hydrolase Cap12 n=1 Tax=Pontibacter sp. MBLB2868 TaxID=3451555 RepID=UPI003F7563E0
MRRKRIFIGSSSEEAGLAETAKTILEKDFDVVIWNDNVWDTAVFKINQNFLNDLLKASLRFDFGLLLGTKDDKVTYRGNEVLQPRDNVLFELGLFMGRLGLNKCAFVVDKELKILSDITGISLARFSEGDNDSFVAAIEQVGEFFRHQVDGDINFFPSSTLASVYFENLIKPTCRYLIENNGLEVDGVKYTQYSIKVIIPKKIHNDLNLQYERLKRNYNTKELTFNYAGRPRNISIEAEIKDNILYFIDFPTILSGINYAISNLLPSDFNIMSADYEAILSREIERFISTLKHLSVREGFDELISYQRV